MFHNAKNSAFAKAVASAIKLDMYDSMRSTLLELGEDLSDKEFLEAFNFNPTVENKKSVKEYMGELVTKMEDYYNTYTSLRKRYADKIIPELYKNNSPKEYAQALLVKQTLDDAIEVLTTNTVLGRQAVVRASGLQQKMGASKTIGASTNEIITRLGSEELMNDEVKKLKEEIAMMTAPQVELSAEQKELLEQKKQELSLVERFQGMYNDVIYPSAETNAYKAFADLVAFYNKRAKINTTIETQDVDDAFIYLVDYMRLNRDSASYVNAMNMLANPRDLKILINAMRTGKEFLNKKLAEEKVKELEKIAGEEGKADARRVTVQLKDKAGNPVSQEIVEGEEYLTEASPEVRVYPKQKTKTTTYKQDIIKIVEIGANQITFTINNSGESVTYTLDEFQERLVALPRTNVYFLETVINVSS
jgi:SpoU rRNA methylase family enzyme